MVRWLTMTELRMILAVGSGAALGGILRLLITQLVVARAGGGNAFYATLIINVSGSFLIGVVLELAQLRGDVQPLWRLFLATGILGGYTTFSTFSYEALALASGGAMLAAALYVLASVALGIAAAYGGIAVVRALAPV
jgi:CrcB protein